MTRFARSLLVLFTMVSALAAGVLNGRVVCMAGAEHVTFEEPHPQAPHSPHDHGCGGEGDTGHGDPGHDSVPSGGCTDIKSGGTLVREVAPASYEHHHLQVALPLVPPVIAATLLAISPRLPLREFDGGPPLLGDLASLRSVILVI